MSNIPRLTFAPSTPVRKLPGQETYKQSAGIATACVEETLVSAFLAERKARLQKRVVIDRRRLSLDVRKAMFLLHFFIIVSAGECLAQTPPPSFNEHAIESVPSTVVEGLATRFSLGSFTGHFEKTTLGKIRAAVGAGNIDHQGDAADSIYWMCFRRAQYRLWVVSHGEIGGPDHYVSEIVEELAEADTQASPDCAVISNRFMPLVFDGKLHLNMSRNEVITAMGPPSKSDAERIIYSHQAKLVDGFDETAWLVLRFNGQKLVFMRGGKSTTN